ALKDNKSKENDSKVLEVAGEVESASGNAIHLKGAEGAPTITCYFEDDQKASIEKLKKGDKVTVRGRWASLVGALGQQPLGRCIIKKKPSPGRKSHGPGRRRTFVAIRVETCARRAPDGPSARRLTAAHSSRRGGPSPARSGKVLDTPSRSIILA